MCQQSRRSVWHACQGLSTHAADAPQQTFAIARLGEKQLSREGVVWKVCCSPSAEKAMGNREPNPQEQPTDASSHNRNMSVTGGFACACFSFVRWALTRVSLPNLRHRQQFIENPPLSQPRSARCRKRKDKLKSKLAVDLQASALGNLFGCVLLCNATV